MALNLGPDKVTGQQHTAQEYNTFKAAILGLDESMQLFILELLKKANLLNGKVPLNELPDLFIVGMTGKGTADDPYIIPESSGGQVSAENYLKGLPGYVVGTEKILYGGGQSGFSWGAIPSGSQDKLGATVLTLGLPSSNSIPLSWVGVIDAQSYLVQRAENALFNNPVQVYNGAALSFAESDLAPATQYWYRVRAIASGMASGDWSTANKTTGVAGGTITPPSPTNGIVNDATNTFDWTNAAGYTNITNYEYTLNGGTSYVQSTVKPIQVGNLNFSVGQVGIRVKADTGRTASATLFNTSPFTKILDTPATPTNPITDDLNDIFDWTNSAGFPTVNSYEITLDGGTNYSQVTEKPYYVGNVNLAIGKVGVRVKAVATVNNASATLFNTVAFSIPIPPALPVITWTDSENIQYTGGNNLLSLEGDNNNYGWASSTVKLPAGGSGFIMVDMINSKNMSAFFLGLGSEPQKTSNSSFEYRFQILDNNRIIGGKQGAYPTSPSMPVSVNSKARMRADGTNIYTEYTINNGVNWVIINTGLQPAIDLYVKVYADAVGSELHNVVQSGLIVG